MGKIVVTEFVSLDGVMEDPGGVGGLQVRRLELRVRRAATRATSSSSTRRWTPRRCCSAASTYEGFADAWPQREGEFADKFNNMPKYVVSSTLDRPRVEQHDRARRRPRRRRSRSCATEHDGDIVVHGSAQLAQALLEQDLVDELRLMVFPVVLGTGKRLFGETSDKKTLKLADSQTVGDGVVILVYGRA